MALKSNKEFQPFLLETRIRSWRDLYYEKIIQVTFLEVKVRIRHFVKTGRKCVSYYFHKITTQSYFTSFRAHYWKRLTISRREKCFLFLCCSHGSLNEQEIKAHRGQVWFLESILAQVLGGVPQALRRTPHLKCPHWLFVLAWKTKAAEIKFWDNAANYN